MKRPQKFIEPVLCEIPVNTPRLNMQDYWDDCVKKYTKQSQKGYNPPPILVAKRKNKIYVLDGFHRLEVAQRLNKKTIIAWVLLWDDVKSLLNNRFNGRMPTCYRDLDKYILCWTRPYYCASSH